MAVALKLKPTVAVIAKVELALHLGQAQIAGEFVNAGGGRKDEIEVAQKAAFNGDLRAIKIFGVDGQGVRRDEIVLDIVPSANGVMLVDADTGDKSLTERLDPGFARAIAARAARLKARGLTPSVWFYFTPEIEADPGRLAEARARLGLKPGTPPEWATQHSCA